MWWTAGDEAGRPSVAVLAEFDVRDELVALSGGQHTVWRAGDIVLKPQDLSADELAGQEQILIGLDGHPEFRVAPPRRSRSGRLVEAGWTAWRYEPGEHEPRRWRDIIDVSEPLHGALATAPRPPQLDRRRDRWAIGDRVAWGELSADGYTEVTPLAALAAARAPVSAPSQLVHGDLTGNVLFAAGLPPLVLDLSPYWRPPQFAAAIVVADALVFEGAGRELVDHVSSRPEFGQCLVRALIYRLVTDHLARQGETSRPDPADRYRSAVAVALDLVSA